MTSVQEKPTKQQIHATWTRYVQNRDQKTRDALVENYLPLLRGIARRVHAKLRGHVELDDLTSSGARDFWPGLIRSIRSAASLSRHFAPIGFAAPSLMKCERWTGCQGSFAAGDANSPMPSRLCPTIRVAVPPTVNWPTISASLREKLRNIRSDDRKAVLVSLSAITANCDNDAMSDGKLDALSDNGIQDFSRRTMGGGV